MSTVVLFALPGLFLVLALLAGRFPGEQAIERARRAVARPHRRRRCAPVRRTGRRPAAGLPRGGRLVATSLASRPPPVPCRTPNRTS